MVLVACEEAAVAELVSAVHVHGQMKVPFGSFLARAAGKASAGQPEPPSQEALVTELKQAFSLIDAHGAEGASRVNADEVGGLCFLCCSSKVECNRCSAVLVLCWG